MVNDERMEAAAFSGLLGMARDRADRVKTLRYALSADNRKLSHAQLIQLFCEHELTITEERLGSLKQRTAKLRHVRAAIDALVQAGADRHAPEVLVAAKKLLEKTENPPLLVEDEIDLKRNHLTIAEQDVVVLESEPGNSMSMQDIVFDAFWSERGRRRRGSQWLAFYTMSKPHVTGKSTWIGLSRSVPVPLVDAIQTAIKSSGLAVEREMCRALHVRLLPFARLSDDGLELLVPAALVGDPTRKRTIDRGETRPVARGYYLKER